MLDAKLTLRLLSSILNLNLKCLLWSRQMKRSGNEIEGSGVDDGVLKCSETNCATPVRPASVAEHD